MQLAADPDTKVRNGAQLLDRLIKDIVTESEGKMFNVEKFIPLLQVFLFWWRKVILFVGTCLCYKPKLQTVSDSLGSCTGFSSRYRTIAVSSKIFRWTFQHAAR